MVIYKYPVVPGEFTTKLPSVSTVVAVQMQGDSPQMWVVVDPESPTVERHYRAVGTGEHFEPGWRYVGTFQLHGGRLVFHLLEQP